MTQMSQPSDVPEMGQPAAEGESPPQVFTAIHREPEPPKSMRKLLIPAGVAVAVIVGGLIFCRGKPDEAEAQKPKPNYASMTADDLAENASVPAARELTRRMAAGTPAERMAASTGQRRLLARHANRAAAEAAVNAPADLTRAC